MRYNLIESKVVGSKAPWDSVQIPTTPLCKTYLTTASPFFQVAGAASVLVPFGVAVLLYTGEGERWGQVNKVKLSILGGQASKMPLTSPARSHRPL